MSGRKSRMRQESPKRVRALLAVLLALALTLPLFGVTFAQDNPTPAATAAATTTEQAAAPATEAATPAAQATEAAAAAAAPAAAVAPAVAPAAVQPNVKYCVNGSVINFDETALPTGTTGPWVITAVPNGGGAAVQQTVDSDANFTFDPLTPGLWEFSIALQPGWEPITPDKFNVDLSVAQDKCVVIRFKLRRPVPVTVIKIDDNYVPQSGWVIRSEPARGNWFASPSEQTTQSPNGNADFRLTEGQWVFSELAPADTVYRPVFPLNGREYLDVKCDIDPANNLCKPVTIYFKNRIYTPGCIDVTKMDVPPGGNSTTIPIPGWKIFVKRMDGTPVASGFTDATGKVKFENLPLGPYKVEEEWRPNWSPVTPTSFTVTLTGKDCEQVDFNNKQTPAYCIEGRKIDTNGKVGIPGWKITATPLNSGGYPKPNADNLEVTTDGTGKYRIDFPLNDYRIPGAAYKVCEEDRDGWLPHTPKCQTVYLPQQPGYCSRAWPFENQQVGHWESVVYGGKKSSSSASCRYHTVQPGESLCGIGNAYGVSCGSMFSANPWVYGQPNHYVYTGQSVCVPGS